MRLPWLRRTRRPESAAAPDISPYRPGSWFDVALPPGGPPVRVLDQPPVSPEPGLSVRLGFEDGTLVDVEGEPGRALREAAGRLLDDGDR